MENNIINISNLNKIFGKNDNQVNALNNINLDIKEGEMLAIIGTSGAGKTTLLNIIGLIDNQTSGDYILNNNNIDNISDSKKASLRNKMFGFIMQDFALIEKYSVKQNVELPLIYNVSKIKKQERINKIKAVLDKVGIKEKYHTEVAKLSGGQRQRVAIARAIVNEPKIILADEPTGSLDNKNKKEIMAILKALNNEGKTIIVITHDKEIAKECSRIIKISDGMISDDLVLKSI